jgi:hypothetical protein
MKKTILICLIFFFFTSLCYSQEKPTNKTDGLEISAGKKINPSTKILKVEAKTQGLAKWFVTSTSISKFIIDEKTNTIEIILPESGKICVAACAILENKTTPFVHSIFEIEKPPAKPVSAPQKTKVFMYFNYSELTSEQLKIINNQYVDFSINYNCFDIKAAVKGGDKHKKILEENGFKPLMIIESGDGALKWFGPVPNTEKEVLQIIRHNTYLKKP